MLRSGVRYGLTHDVDPGAVVRMAERSKAPDSRVKLFLIGAFWSTNVGVGSNPTSDKRFRLLRKCEHTVGLH